MRSGATRWTSKTSRRSRWRARWDFPPEQVFKTLVVRGGVTALGGRKAYPVCVDETALRFDVIAVSAGMRGAQVVLPPDDYVRATKATIGAIQKDKAR